MGIGERGLEELEEDDELDMYSAYKDQKEWREKLLSESGRNFTPIKPPTRVRIIDESSSPKRITMKSMEELKSMRASGLWVFRAEGFEDGEYTYHVGLRGKR